MDPLLFGMKSDVVLEVIGTIIVLSIFVDRFLAPIFDWRIVLNKNQRKGVKEPVALASSFVVVYILRLRRHGAWLRRVRNS